MLLEKDREAKVKLLAEVLVVPILNAEEALEIGGNAPRVQDPLPGSYVLADQHGLAEGMSDSNLDIDVGLVQRAEIVKKAEIRVLDPGKDILENAFGAQVITRPPESDAVRLEEVDQVETEGAFNIFQEAVPHEAGQIAFPWRAALSQALKKWKLAAVWLTQIDDAHAAERGDIEGFRSSFEEAAADTVQCPVLSKLGELIVVLVRGDEAVEKTVLKKSGQEGLDETLRVGRAAGHVKVLRRS
jgi:hypothetical protein